MIQFRRSYRLRMTPAVLGLSALALFAAIQLGASAEGFGGLYVIFVFYWVLFALLNWSRRLVIEDDRLRMYGYFGGPIVIEKTNVYSCRYRLYHGNMRGSPDMFFFEIRDREFHEIDVWRFGWGRRRRELFERLKSWLDESSCTLAPTSSHSSPASLRKSRQVAVLSVARAIPSQRTLSMRSDRRERAATD